MTPRFVILLIWLSSMPGCIEYREFTPDHMDRWDGQLIVMTKEKEIYRLRDARFFAHHLAGTGERFPEPSSLGNPFKGQIPYETISWLGYAGVSTSQTMLAVGLFALLFGFLLLSTQKDEILDGSSQTASPGQLP